MQSNKATVIHAVCGLIQALSPGMAASQLQDLADAVRVLPQQAQNVADSIQQVQHIPEGLHNI